MFVSRCGTCCQAPAVVTQDLAAYLWLLTYGLFGCLLMAAAVKASCQGTVVEAQSPVVSILVV